MPMSALHKLKAYFGMVPADEVDEYGDELAYRDHYEDEAYDDERPAARRVGARGGYRADAETESFAEEFREPSRQRRQWASEVVSRGTSHNDFRGAPHGDVRGAPHGDPRADGPRSNDSNVSRLRAVTDTGTQFNLSKITTLHPRSYSEARTIGEQYRDGTPVIMNLTEMEEADAKRLVDFAAGLAFALRGSIEKVTSRVFLLSPPNVDVAAEDKRRLAEGAFFNYG